MASERESVRGYDTLAEGSTPVVQEGAEKEAELLRQLEELNRWVRANTSGVSHTRSCSQSGVCDLFRVPVCVCMSVNTSCVMAT